MAAPAANLDDGHHAHPHHRLACGRAGLGRSATQHEDHQGDLLERVFITPYFVNYHLKHHLLMCVPCYNLAKAHAILMRGPYAGRMEARQFERSAHGDCPAGCGRPAWRRRQQCATHAAGIRIGDDQASAGFLVGPDGATGQTNVRSALGQKQTSTACPL